MRLVVAGSPVAHSLSPIIHTAAFEACGIPGTYGAVDCDADGFAAVLDQVRMGSLDGCNVTMPHKKLAYGAVDEPTSLARRCGAVNTVARVGHHLIGHNTDVAGIRQAWEWARLPDDAPALILGAGGASAAALLALEGRRLAISARRPEAAAELTRTVGVDAEPLPFGTPLEGGVLVNATPIGMGGEALPEPLLAAAIGLFEMPYRRVLTPATTFMRDRSLPVAVGEDMLLAQALEAFRIWTGRRAPLEPIRTALRAHMEPPAT